MTRKESKVKILCSPKNLWAWWKCFCYLQRPGSLKQSGQSSFGCAQAFPGPDWMWATCYSLHLYLNFSVTFQPPLPLGTFILPPTHKACPLKPPLKNNFVLFLTLLFAYPRVCFGDRCRNTLSNMTAHFTAGSTFFFFFSSNQNDLESHYAITYWHNSTRQNDLICTYWRLKPY